MDRWMEEDLAYIKRLGGTREVLEKALDVIERRIDAILAEDNELQDDIKELEYGLYDPLRLSNNQYDLLAQELRIAKGSSRLLRNDVERLFVRFTNVDNVIKSLRGSVEGAS